MPNNREIDLLVDETLRQIIAEGAPNAAGLSEKLCAVIRERVTRACLVVQEKTASVQRHALERFLRASL